MKIAAKTLQNNFKVIYAKDTSNPLICMQLYIRTGSADEFPEEAGFSHFTEHLVFKSTIKFPANALMERITYLGGHINAYTEYDSTCFYLTIASEFTKEGLEILSELAQFANFDEEQFQFEKKVIIEELKQYENEPEDNFLEQIATHYFRQHPYRNPIIGNRESIRKAKKHDLEKFYHNQYVPSNAYLVVCGKFIETDLFSHIDELFGKWQDATAPKAETIEEKFPDKPAFFYLENGLKNDIIAFVFPDLKEIHPDSHSLSLGVKQFAMGKNSRLYKRLFHEEKLIDSIKIHSICGKLNGISTLMIFPKKKANLSEIVEITLQEWKKLLLYGLTENEMSEQKKENAFHYRYLYEYVESMAASLGNEELTCGYENFLVYPDRINSLTKKQVDTALRKYFQLNHVYLFQCGKKQKLDSASLMPKFDIPHKQIESSRPKVWQKTLPNGMKIIFKKATGKPTIGIAATVKVSHLNEEKSELGINLLTSTLMLYGNHKRNHEQFMQFCRSQGISFGIAPEIETTTVKIKCFKESILTALELLSDVLNYPLFSEDHFKNIRQTIISNIDRRKDYPQMYAQYLWNKMFFGSSSQFFHKEGTKTSLGQISLKKIRTWHQSYYRPSNLTIAIVGDFQFDELSHHLEFLFPTFPESKQLLFNSLIMPNPTTFYRKTNHHLSQSYIHFGGFGCNSAESQKNTAFHVLAQIVGGDTNSILFNELRENSGLAYVADFDFRSTRKLGVFQAFTIVDKSNEKEAVAIIKKALKSIQIQGISNYELQKTVNYIRGNRLLEEESVLSQASAIAKLVSIGLGYDYYLQRDIRLQNVQLTMLKEIAEEYFHEQNFYVHILG
jgi:zinc protease